MQFKFEGSREPNFNKIPAGAQKAIEILDSLEDGNFVDSERLSVLTGYTISYIISELGRYLRNYYIKTSSEGAWRNFYGNQNTVKAWKAKK